MVLRAIVAMVAATSVLAIASSADAGSLADCGQRVIRDWYSGGRVDRIYPLPCYRAAIRALPDDVLQYTDASAAIERALETARQGAASRAPVTSDDAEVVSPSVPRAAAKASQPPVSMPSAPPHNPTRLASGPSHETAEPGVPYPLVALGALSLVLLVSGVAAGLAHRRH